MVQEMSNGDIRREMMNELQTKPRVGNGAYVSNVVDCQSVTIVEVSECGEYVTVQRDSVRLVVGSAPYSNKWEMKPNENGALYYFTLRSNGQYVTEGENDDEGCVLHLSGRYEYYDYGF